VELIKRYFCKTTQISVIFLHFQMLKKQTNLRLPLNVQKLKVFQLQGALPPDPRTGDSAHGPCYIPF